MWHAAVPTGEAAGGWSCCQRRLQAGSGLHLHVSPPQPTSWLSPRQKGCGKHQSLSCQQAITPPQTTVQPQHVGTHPSWHPHCAAGCPHAGAGQTSAGHLPCLWARPRLLQMASREGCWCACSGDNAEPWGVAGHGVDTGGWAALRNVLVPMTLPARRTTLAHLLLDSAPRRYSRLVAQLRPFILQAKPLVSLLFCSAMKRGTSGPDSVRMLSQSAQRRTLLRGIGLSASSPLHGTC